MTADRTAPRNHPRRNQQRRGFSIIEAVVVVSLISIVSAAAVVWFSAGSQPDTDAAAKTSLVAFAEAQNQAYREGSPVLDASALASRDYTRSYTTSPSSGPTEVSVSTSGTLAFAAVSTGGGTCWMLRVDNAPQAGSAPVVWYVDNREPCAAGDIAILPVPSDGSGSGPSNPYIVP